MQTLSSFIGIDGVNPTMNSGRIQINLKPLDERTARAPEIIRRLQPKLAAVEGITLYMQPVQDLTHRDPRGAHAVSVQPGGRRRQRTGGLDAAPDGRAAKSPRAARRGERPADRRAEGDARHRPRQRRALRHHAAGDRRHALRRVRPAPGLDDLHAAQPVPRRAGSGAASSRAAPRICTKIFVRSATNTQVPLSQISALRNHATRRW